MMSVWRTCAKNFCLFFSQNANMVTPSTIPTDSHRSIGWEVAALHDDMCCMASSKQVATFLHAGELPLPMLPLSTRDQLLLLAPCHLCSTFIVCFAHRGLMPAPCLHSNYRRGPGHSLRRSDERCKSFFSEPLSL